MKLYRLSEDGDRPKLRRVWDTTRNKWVLTRKPEVPKEPEFHVDDQFGEDPDKLERKRRRHAEMKAKLDAYKAALGGNY